MDSNPFSDLPMISEKSEILIDARDFFPELIAKGWRLRTHLDGLRRELPRMVGGDCTTSTELHLVVEVAPYAPTLQLRQTMSLDGGGQCEDCLVIGNCHTAQHAQELFEMLSKLMSLPSRIPAAD